MDVGGTKKAYCRNCVNDRNCEVKGFFAQGGDNSYFSWNIDWIILQCRGCDEVFCQTVGTNSDDFDYFEDENGKEERWHSETVKYWPAKSKRARPDWFSDLDSPLRKNDEIWEPLVELYGALDSDLTMLATIGVRTVFDVCSVALGVDHNLTFKQKLEKLVDIRKIGALDKDNLEILVEAGNASAHRGWLPSTQELSTIVDILEHFVETSFIGPEKRKKLDEKAKKLKEKVPRRTK